MLLQVARGSWARRRDDANCETCHGQAHLHLRDRMNQRSRMKDDAAATAVGSAALGETSSQIGGIGAARSRNERSAASAGSLLGRVAAVDRIKRPRNEGGAR